MRKQRRNPLWTLSQVFMQFHSGYPDNPRRARSLACAKVCLLRKSAPASLREIQKRSARCASICPRRWAALFYLCTSFAALAQGSKAPVASIEALIRSHEYTQALDNTKSALRETPSDFRLWTLEGIVLSIQGDRQSALAAFEKALSFSPKYPPRSRVKSKFFMRHKISVRSPHWRQY